MRWPQGERTRTEENTFQTEIWTHKRDESVTPETPTQAVLANHKVIEEER
jgi:hypothetical protein